MIKINRIFCFKYINLIQKTNNFYYLFKKYKMEQVNKTEKPLISKVSFN